ncbi:unnamed protein product [Sphagnum jensenii]|uniref:Uncharacterized protein n=1 Tax=Sphagnum jensenii TaxID=128206 RepID=A0ABP1AS00_9BRYO
MDSQKKKRTLTRSVEKIEKNQQIPIFGTQNDGDSEGLDETSRTFERLVQRSALEEEVLLLQTRLEEELELRSVLESALSNVSGALTSFPHHLPIAAQELLADITVLEVAVLKLKEKSTALQWQVGQERTEREIALLRQGRSGTLMSLQPMIRHQDPGSSGFSPSFSSSPNLKHLTKTQLTDRQGCQAAELTLQQLQIIEKDYEDLKTKYSLSNGHHDDVQHSIQKPFESFFTQSSLLTSAVVAESCEDDPMLLSAETTRTPNQLSEQMVHCMVSIYCHLADLNLASLKVGSSSPSRPSRDGIHSPTSPFGGSHQANSDSLSSISESSLLSFARSPLVDLRNKEEEEVIGTDAMTPDPFKVPDKIPWRMDIGAYGHTFEVPWLSVGKHQLEYAAQALKGFKLLVEQLASVDPSHLSHDEKLAFWINLYNTVMMHGYLAYGIPQSDLKFFSLLQKAAYTVGGHSFNAATIEYCLLKSKSTATRPQIMLLMALHRNKLTEAQMKFGIEQPEPLINFALCCGTRSAPMVRIYTADKVHLQLQDAFHDYIQAAVGMSTKGKLLVPKLLQCYAREFVEDNALLAWICDLLPNSQVAMICEYVQQRHRHHRILGSRNFTIIPFDFTFRYLFPADIARELMSI